MGGAQVQRVVGSKGEVARYRWELENYNPNLFNELFENGELTDTGKKVLITFSYLLTDDPSHMPNDIKEKIGNVQGEMIKLWQFCYDEAKGSGKTKVKNAIKIFYKVLLGKNKVESKVKDIIEKFQMPLRIFSFITIKDVDVGEGVADVVDKDDALANFLEELGNSKADGEDLSAYFNKAGVFVNGKAYFEPTKAGIDSMIKELDKVSGIERKVYSLTIARKWGDIRKIAKECFGITTIKGKDINEVDEVEVLEACLKKIRTNKKFWERYRKAMGWVGWPGLDYGLDILAKYAFLTHTYDAFQHTYGDVNLFKEFIENLNDALQSNSGSRIFLASQIASSLFSDTIPMVIKESVFDSSIQDTINMILLVNLQAAAIIQHGVSFAPGENQPIEERFYLNPYRTASALPDCAKKAIINMRKNYLYQMIYKAATSLYLTDPSNLPSAGLGWIEGPPQKQDFSMRTASDQFIEDVRNIFLQMWASRLKQRPRELIAISGVRDPQGLFNYLFNKMFTPEMLELMEEGRGRVSVHIPLLYANFMAEFLKTIPEGDAIIPSGMEYANLWSSGYYCVRSYDETKDGKVVSNYEDRYGFLTTTVEEWGPLVWQRFSGTISSGNNITLESLGKVYEPNWDMFRRFINYLEVHGGELKTAMTYQHFMKPRADYVVGLEYNKDGEHAGEYKATLYHRVRKEDGEQEFEKISVQYFSPEEAYRLFGGYIGHNSDIRGLFENGHLTGMMLAFQLSKNGAAYIQNETQKTAILTHILSEGRIATAIGGLVYMDKTAKEALGNYWGKDKIVEMVGGKENGENVYGMALARKWERKSLGTYFLHSADSQAKDRFGIGFETPNSYAVIDLLKGGSGWDGDIVCGISWNEGNDTYSMHLEHWHKVQRYAIYEWLYGGYSTSVRINYLGNLIYGMSATDYALYKQHEIISSVFKIAREGGIDALISPGEFDQIARVTDPVLQVLCDGIKDAITYKLESEDGGAGVEVASAGGDDWVVNVYTKNQREGVGLTVGKDSFQWFGELATVSTNLLRIAGLMYYTHSDPYFRDKFMTYYTQGKKSMERTIDGEIKQSASLLNLGGGTAGGEAGYLRAWRRFVSLKDEEYNAVVGVIKHNEIEGGHLDTIGAGFGRARRKMGRDTTQSRRWWILGGWIGGKSKENIDNALRTLFSSHIFGETGIGLEKITRERAYNLYGLVRVRKSVGKRDSEKMNAWGLDLAGGGHVEWELF
jgi:hypothetical protein